MGGFLAYRKGPLSGISKLLCKNSELKPERMQLFSRTGQGLFSSCSSSLLQRDLSFRPASDPSRDHGEGGLATRDSRGPFSGAPKGNQHAYKQVIRSGRSISLSMTLYEARWLFGGIVRLGRNDCRHRSSNEREMPYRRAIACVMGDMPWGAHICLFYETKEDLLDANAAYIKAGLDSNKYRAWPISEPISEDEAWAVLRRDIPDLDNRATSGQFEILPGYDWYLKGDEFDSKKITSGWHEKLQFALDKGLEALRISGNAFWIERKRCNEFREYEQELDESLEDRPMLVLCTYSLSASRGRCTR